jgi:prephenate dehydrogenase
MRAVGGTTYKLLLTLVESVISEDPELYASLQMSLPGMTKIRNLLQRSLETWSDIVDSKDRKDFVQRMNGLRDGLEKGDPAFQKSYENMYKVVEGL